MGEDFAEREVEAVMTALAHHALARAELLRALSAIRSEEAVLAARRAHLDAVEIVRKSAPSGVCEPPARISMRRRGDEI